MLPLNSMKIVSTLSLCSRHDLFLEGGENQPFHDRFAFARSGDWMDRCLRPLSFPDFSSSITAFLRLAYFMQPCVNQDFNSRMWEARSLLFFMYYLILSLHQVSSQSYCVEHGFEIFERAIVPSFLCRSIFSYIHFFPLIIDPPKGRGEERR